MKLNKITIAEIILLTLFIASYLFQQVIPINWRWVTLLLYALLGAIYFPLGFYTLKSSKYKSVYAVLFGMLFALSLTALLFSLLKVVLGIFLLLFLIVIYIMIPIIQAVSFYLYDKKEGQIFMYDFGITIRYLLLLALIIYAAVTFHVNFSE